jgi:hypothetical protein
MRRTPATLTAVGVLALSGVAHGVRTERWRGTEETAAGAARLDQIRLTLGDWQGRRLEFAPERLQGAAGCFWAQFTRARDGRTVGVFVVAGRPGPVAEHTPDVCYEASGFRVGTRQKISLGGAELATAALAKDHAAGRQRLRIYWAWSPDGKWSAPEYPRIAFARYGALYKLYVLRELSRTDESVEDEPCCDLLRRLLPELQQALFGASKPPPSNA